MLLLTLTAVVVAAGGLWAAIANFGEPVGTSDQGNVPDRDQAGISPQLIDPETAPVSIDPSGPPVRRNGNLDLTQNYYADLDSDSGDWDVSSSFNAGFSHDLHFTTSRESLALRAQFYSDIAIADGLPARYETCANASAYTSSVDFEKLVPGTVLCVRTSGKRLALALVKSADENPPGTPAVIRFDVAVWDRQ